MELEEAADEVVDRAPLARTFDAFVLGRKNWLLLTPTPTPEPDIRADVVSGIDVDMLWKFALPKIGFRSSEAISDPLKLLKQNFTFINSIKNGTPNSRDELFTKPTFISFTTRAVPVGN